MKNKKILLVFVLLLLSVSLKAQETPFGENVQWISGYKKEISGETLTYFSAFPDFINQSLLTRATDGNKNIEWETAETPAEINGQYVYFRWVAAHSTGTSKGNRNFDFYINDEKAITLTTTPENKTPLWSFENKDGTKIVFVQSKTDGANDAHGIAYLRVPASRVQPNKPLKLKLVGQAQQSNDWFMTFKYSFEEKAEVAAQPFLLKNGQQPVSINILHFGKKEKLAVTLNESETKVFDLNDGMNFLDFPITAVSKNEKIHISAKYADKVLFDGDVEVKPVVRREIHFIHHSHTDIGYSHLQPEVERIHTKNIRDALRLIDETKDFPEESKFKWNIESLWAVENFLREASEEEKTKFVAAVRSGGIGLSALYANMLTGLSMPEEVFHYTDYAQILQKKYGLKIESAMISDVPGFAWNTVAGLSKGGVKYFSSGPNYLGKNHPYLGDRVGHFVREWGDKPVWWESPSGKEKILFWTAGRGYSSWHSNAPGAIFDNGTRKIAEYLNDLTATNYPYEMVQWRYNVVSDNAPLDPKISVFVRQWNEKYAAPKIVLNTTEKMFAEFEKRYADKIPTVKGDITPYWEDGAASTANETGMNRRNSLRLQQLTMLYAMLAPSRYNADEFYEAWKNILLFHEHTWGAHNSVSEPDAPFVIEQWRIKRDFALNADRKINELTEKLLQPLSDISSSKIAVVNSLSWTRNAPVYLDAKTNANIVVDEKGKEFPLQKTADGKMLFIAENVKPLSVSYYYLRISPQSAALQKNFRLERKRLACTNANAFEKVSSKTQVECNSAHFYLRSKYASEPLTLQSQKTPFVLADNNLSNGKISVTWDKENGSLTKLEKDNFNYARNFKTQGLNGFWYVPGLDPSQAVSNDKVQISVEEQGVYKTTIAIRSNAQGANNLLRKITLYANDDKVLVENTIDKKSVRTKEAVYFSFPFAENLNRVTFDAGYGTTRFLDDQLAGSNMDFVSPRRWLDASDAKNGIQLMMIEPFMASPESMVDERLTINQSHKEWRKNGTPTAKWFSYVMNNYWHTNYKSDQSGTSFYHYALKPHGILQATEQEKSAMEFTQPLVAFPVKEQAKNGEPFVELTNNKIVITSITPQPNGGLMMRIFNPNDTAQSTFIKYNKQNKEVKLDGYEVKELLVK